MQIKKAQCRPQSARIGRVRERAKHRLLLPARRTLPNRYPYKTHGRERRMDQKTIKTPKTLNVVFTGVIRVYILGDTVSHVGLFDLLWTSAYLTFSLVHLPPFPVWSTGLCVYTVCETGGGGGMGGDWVVWRASTGVIHYLFVQISNLLNCFTTFGDHANQKG